MIDAPSDRLEQAKAFWAQALATAHLLGTPPAFVAAASEPSNHLGLFMGAQTHAHAWPRIAEWLRDDLSGVLARSA